MQESLLLFGLMVVTVALAAFAKRFALPYPIVFVVGGGALAFIPHLPPLRIRSDLVFLIILPPLLYSGGWLTDIREFKRNARAIGLLAIGLVITTTLVVAWAAHAWVPGLAWPAAFALGAIVSPPDAVAAGAVFERFNVPRRIMSILEGEGLVNDATALTIYRFAVAAALTGAFSLTNATIAFVVVAVGGVAVGLAIGWIVAKVTRALNALGVSDTMLDNLMLLLAPYAAYLSADSLQLSGVLAAVVAGVYASRSSSHILEPASRLTSYAIWELMIFLFNAFLFLSIGLEVREIVTDPAIGARYLVPGIAISVLCIVVRIAWVFPATYVPRWLSARLRAKDPAPSWRSVAIIAWSGMRGIVSLAAALALPNLGSGQPFPGRPAILFITFCVILATLVVQGLSLIPIVKYLGLRGGEKLEEQETTVRVAALRAGVTQLRKLEPKFDSIDEWEVEGRIVAEYAYRIQHLEGHAHGDQGESEGSRIDHRLQGEALRAERREIMRLRENGEIPDEIFRRIEYDLDLADERLS